MKKTITLFLCTFATSGLMAQGNTSWMVAGIDPAQMRDVPSQSSIRVLRIWITVRVHLS